MIKPISAKFAAVALLATTAACSCIEAPDLDVAPAAVSKKYEDTGYKAPMVEKQAVASGNLNKSKAMLMPLDRVFFGFDSAVLTPAAQSALRDVAAYAKAKGIKNMVVEGHCDERGTREYNLALGDRRAVAIKRYLTSLGVDGRGITTVSYGKERPADMGHNEAAWAKNRRGVVVFK
ncbi:MAG: peptidoglycan-associated lipoprotein Pal [Alphaproteobacteria bacterium]|nr:peptidoglycan-associated lipoprotein Pal [Alphaproteobacteria bacterium]MDD9919489.1 peptidoglycan-associated lipoprotein Pal [Alphaproteobacteria bacterium]